MTDYGVYNANMGTNWWLAPKATIYKEIFNHLAYLDNNQTRVTSDNIRNMRLYGNYDIYGLEAFNYAKVEASFNVSHRVTLNIVASMIDTITAKITKNKPKPQFLTDEGDWELQQKAKKLTKYCEGIFYSAQVYKEFTRAFTDSCVFGTGAVKFFVHDNEVKCERVMIEEIKVDEQEAIYGNPRTLHQIKFIQKDIVKGLFPGNDIEIDTAAAFESEYNLTRYFKNKDMMYIVESWHLPSSKDMKDGKHVISIANKTLMYEDYEKDYFPFVFHRYQERQIGFFGMGIAEQLTGLQVEINKILKTIQIAMHLVCIPKVLVEASSKIVTAHLNNKIGGIIKYAGNAPTQMNMGTISPELFQHLERLINQAYQITGVSQLSAQAQKPSGLNSGKALREYNDIETERFMTVGLRYEQSFMDAAKIIIDFAKEIAAETGGFKVRVKGTSFVETIDWSDIDLDDDKYMMQVFPISALSSSPSDRLQDVTELIQAGFISKEDGMRLLDFPDLKAVTDIYNSSLDDIHRTIDQMMKDGQYQTPEPFQNLALGIKIFQSAYLQYRGQNAPEEKLDLLRNWVSDAQALLAKMNPPAPMAPQGAPAAPIANPQAAPQSDILPMANATPPVIPGQ